MALVPAKCTHCGGKLEVDNTKEAAICPYCGQAYIVEQAINYITNNNNVSNTITNSMVFITNNTQADANKYFEECVGYLKINASRKAIESITEARRLDPDNGKYLFYYSIACESLSEYLKKFPQYQEWEVEFLESKIYARCYIRTFIGGRYNTMDKERCKLFYDIYGGFNGDVSVWNFFVDRQWRNIDEIKYLIELDIKKEFQPYKKDGYGGYISIYEYACGKKWPGHEYDDFNENGTNFAVRDLIEQNYTEGRPERYYDTGSGCYIATCVYGSYDCPQVWTLRRFRDYTLDETWYGRIFIKCYYAISPTLVKWFGNRKWFRTFWKNRLDTMVSKLNNIGIDNTEYSDKY